LLKKKKADRPGSEKKKKGTGGKETERWLTVMAKKVGAGKKSFLANAAKTSGRGKTVCSWGGGGCSSCF